VANSLFDSSIPVNQFSPEPGFDGEFESAPTIRPEKKHRSTQPPGRRIVTGLLLLVSIGLLLLAAFSQRNILAARFSGLKPLLQQVCASLQCNIESPKDLDSIQIESSGFDPQEDGRYLLSLQLRHNHAYSIATPNLMVLLLDPNDQPLMQMEFSPEELELPAEIPNGSGLIAEKLIQLPDQPQALVTGYRFNLRYP
jgi:hypothetical protein